jgi:hypothetical protein
MALLDYELNEIVATSPRSVIKRGVRKADN